MKKAFKKEYAAFGAKVKALRKERKLTQADLAAEIDMDERTIRFIEKGRYNPSLRVVFALAKAFGVDVRELFS